MAVIGYGGRGEIYGNYALAFPQKYKLVAVAETNPYRLKKLEGKGVDR